MKYLMMIFVLVLTLTSCQNDDGDMGPKDFSEQNEKEIIDYLEANNLEAQRTSSGLYFIIEEEGEGDQPVSNSTVTVIYKGYYSNGKVFDQSNQDGITFNLQQVIAGWTEGITYFKEGSKGMLLIPSRLAYGSDDRNGIPGGSVLIFDIELVNIQ